MSEPNHGIDLVQAVQAVRSQLIAAAESGRDEPLRFEVGEIHMEFTVELRYDAHVKGGVKAWVFSAEADAGHEKAYTNKVSFTLKPKDAGTGDGWEVGNEDKGDASAFGRLGD